MKKTFVMLMFAVAANIASAENSVTVQRAVFAPGEANFVYINLNNETPCAGVSYEMHLPKGITFYNEATVAQTTGSTRVSYYSDEEFDDVTCLTQIQKSIFTDTDGHQYGIVASAGGFDVLGNSGQLFRCRLQVASDMEPGVYPIVFKDLFYSDATTTQQINLKDRTYTSYIVIGDPTNAELALEGEVGSEINAALATEAAVKTLNLTNVTASYGDFTYVAGRKVVAPATDVNASVKFDAPLAGTYGSFCAPVDVNVDCFTYSSCDGTTAVFAPATTAPANTPVLINKAVKTAAQADVLKTVEGRQITKGYYVANDGSGMRSVNSTATIPALRGAWEDIVASSNLRIAIETATGIEYIGTAEEVFGNTYDLQGRQVQNAKNGVFVVNGKKQFVK